MKNKLLAFFIVLFLVPVAGFAALINSNVVTGNWSAPASWAGGVVPTANDTAVIVGNANITVDNNSCVAYKCRILNLGVLNCSSFTLTLAGSLTSINVSGTDYWYVGNGSLSIYTGGTFNLQTGTLRMTGNLLTNGTFNCGTGTVIIDTKRAPVSWYGTNSPVFYHVINNDSIPASYPVAGGFGVTLHSVNTTFRGNVTINGTFNRNSSVNADATVTFDGNTSLSGVYSFYLNHVVINTGASVYSNAKNFNIYGNWTNNGLFDGGTGTVTFFYDPVKPSPIPTDQTITAKNGFFYNLTINKTTGTVTQIDSVVVKNNFRVTRGTYIQGLTPVRLYVAGNFTVASTGVFNAAAGRVILNGSSLITTQKVYAYNSSFYKLTVNNTGDGVQLDTNLTVTYEMVLTNGIVYTHDGTYFNELFLSNNAVASLLGGSSSSYVAGKLRRAITGTGNYVFAVGPYRYAIGDYRPVTFLLTAVNGASNVLVYQDTIGNAGTYKANFYSRIIPDAGTPSGNLNFVYNLLSDFPASTTECAMSAIRGTVPPPANWNFVLPTVTGASSGTLTSQAPAAWTDNAFILGEPTPVINGTTICEGSQATLTIASPGGSGTFSWYDAPTAGSLLQASSPTYTTPVLTSTTSYYAEHINATTLCASHRTPVTVTVSPQVQVNAGINDSVCTGNAYVFYTASASGYASLNWTSTGTGTFLNNGTVTPTYNPSAADISAGQVKLILAGNPIAPCSAVTDTMVLKILPNPTVNAGIDDTICEGSTFAVTSAAGSGYTALTWSTFGDGSFAGGNTLSPVYTPGSADITAEAVTLVLQTSSSCGTTSDQMILHITRSPDISVPEDTVICSSLSYQVVNATGNYYSSVNWTTSGDGNFTGGSTMTPLYQPGPGDLSAGQVMLILTAQPNTPCAVAKDTIVLYFTDAAQVFSPGADTICAGSSYTVTGVSASNYSSLSWQSSGSGSFTGQGTLNATYNPSLADTAAGSVVLTLIAAGNAPCEGDTAQMTLHIVPGPQADAGNDVTVCAQASATLSSASALNYQSLLWTTTGDGNISGSTTLNPVYQPGPADITAGSVSLIMQVQGNSYCAWVYDTVVITITPLPVAAAGPDIDVCAGADITLNGNSGLNYQTVLWQTSGDGVFSFNGSLHPVYYPGSADETGGAVSLIFSVTSNCGTDTDTLMLNIHPNPIAEAGAAQLICTGTGATLTAAGNTGSVAWLWSTGDTNQSVQVAPLANTLYYLTVTNSYGCVATDSVLVGIKPQPAVTLEILPDMNVYYEGQALTFVANPSGLDTYNFYIDGSLVQSGTANVFVTDDLLQGQSVTVDAFENGCQDTEVLLPVIHIIPNTFTPNGDGLNDVFVRGLDLTIINRWGQTLYQGMEGWDGRYKGENVSPGTYFFIIRMSDLNGIVSEIKGSVKVAR